MTVWNPGGAIGVWQSQFSWLESSHVMKAASALEDAGYAALWYPESFGREAMVTASLLLQATSGIDVASGIANIWGRDAVAMANGARSLAEAHDGRFVLGIGVSHRPLVERRGHSYSGRVDDVASYIDAMDASVWDGPEVQDPPLLLAALGPRMLELAGRRTAGAHPYFSPVEHTRTARNILGPEATLAPEQMLIPETDPSQARALARGAAATYLRLPNYLNNLRRAGFTEADFATGGSDRLIDAVFAWGPTERLVERVNDHLAAGANHVCIQLITEDRDRVPVAELVELAPALHELNASR